MTLFTTLARHLSWNKDLTLSPDYKNLGDAKTFTVTNGVHILTLEFIDERYIEYRDPTGTPSEIFEIQSGHLTAQNHKPMTIDQFGAYLAAILKDINLPVSRRLGAQ